MRKFRAVVRWSWPWLLAAASLTWIFVEIDWHDLAAAFRGRHLAAYLAFSIALLGADLLADAFGLRYTFGREGARLRYRELVAVRAATYLVGVIQYYLGQAALLAYVHRRTGTPVARATGIILVVNLLNFGALALLSAIGLALVTPRLPWFRPAAAAVVVALLGYGAMIRLRPPFLVHRSILAPLFAFGALGHGVGLLAWMPYLLINAIWYAATLRWFGVPVSWTFALVTVPIILMAASLPLSFQGLGLAQVAAVFFYCPPASRSSVFAATLAMTSVSLIAQGGFGLVGLPVAKRLGAFTASPASPASSARPPADPSS